MQILGYNGFVIVVYQRQDKATGNALEVEWLIAKGDRTVASYALPKPLSYKTFDIAIDEAKKVIDLSYTISN